MYGSDTWLEFHQLLLTTLNGYIGALAKRREVERSMKDMKDREQNERSEKERQEKLKNEKERQKELKDRRKAEREEEARKREWEEKEKEQFYCTQEIFNFSHLLW